MTTPSLPLDPHAALYGSQSAVYAATALLARTEGHGRLCACYAISFVIHLGFALLHCL